MADAGRRRNFPWRLPGGVCNPGYLERLFGSFLFAWILPNPTFPIDACLIWAIFPLGSSLEASMYPQILFGVAFHGGFYQRV